MKSLVIFLFAVCLLVKGQLNQPCTADVNCINGTAPCVAFNCFCDPTQSLCKVAPGISCTDSSVCSTNSACISGVCIGLDGGICSTDAHCVPNADCVLAKCRAQPGFAWDPITLEYSPCGSDCSTCYDPANNSACLSCEDPYKITVDGQCICTDGTAAGFGVCLACDPHCGTCALPMNPFACTSCSNPLMVLISGVCICPTGARNPATATCEPCHSSCATCSLPNDPRYCTSCTSGTLISGVCTNKCPNPRTAFENGTCLPCDSSCLTCMAPNNPTRCTSCKSGYTLIGGTCICQKPGVGQTKMDLVYSKLPPKKCGCKQTAINNVCKCNEGFKGDSALACDSDRYCLPCHASCLTCFAPNDPTACTSCCCGYKLVNGMCLCVNPTLALNPLTTLCESCGPSCTSCIVAGDDTQCLTCATPGAIQYNGICICPAGTFRGPTGACVGPCTAPCLECYVNNSATCTKCAPGYIPFGGGCICANGTASPAKTCVAFDASGMCISYDPGTCLPCHFSCLTCVLPGSPFYCTSCVDPTAILVNGQCVCPTLTVMDLNGTCVPCPSGFIYAPNGTCVPTQLIPPTICPNGTYLSGDECIPCPSQCATCDPTNGTCTSCRNGTALNMLGHCIPCPPCCPTCFFDINKKLVCSSCVNDLVYNGLQCVLCRSAIPNCARCVNCVCAACSPGYYRFNETLCKPCSGITPGCKNCTDNGVCTSCMAPYRFDNRNHICKCPHKNCDICGKKQCEKCSMGFYIDLQGSCNSCHPTCAHCNHLGNNKCTKCHPGAKLINGICKCLNGCVFVEHKKACLPRGR